MLLNAGVQHRPGASHHLGPAKCRQAPIDVTHGPTLPGVRLTSASNGAGRLGGAAGEPHSVALSGTPRPATPPGLSPLLHPQTPALCRTGCLWSSRWVGPAGQPSSLGPWVSTPGPGLSLPGPRQQRGKGAPSAAAQHAAGRVGAQPAPQRLCVEDKVRVRKAGDTHGPSLLTLMALRGSCQVLSPSSDPAQGHFREEDRGHPQDSRPQQGHPWWWAKPQTPPGPPTRGARPQTPHVHLVPGAPISWGNRVWACAPAQRPPDRPAGPVPAPTCPLQAGTSPSPASRAPPDHACPSSTGVPSPTRLTGEETEAQGVWAAARKPAGRGRAEGLDSRSGRAAQHQPLCHCTPTSGRFPVNRGPCWRAAGAGGQGWWWWRGAQLLVGHFQRHHVKSPPSCPREHQVRPLLINRHPLYWASSNPVPNSTPVPSLPLFALNRIYQRSRSNICQSLVQRWLPINWEGKGHGYLVTTGSCD